jgi:phosphatidylglycerol:prolipoprotein diacylglycerol transferase
MYLLGFLLAFVLLPRLQQLRGLKLTRDDWASLISWGVLGVIIGGRLGYVLLYEPMYFAADPSEIIAVWRGGMSSHGGFIGVTLVLFLWSYWHKVDLRKLADIIVIPAAIGLAIGRIGNFINQELYGTVTTIPWAIEIPGVIGLRHPVQLYAMLNNLLIAGLCFLHLRSVTPVHPGRTAALFLILYGIMRFLLEYLRAQEYPLINLGILLSRGQLYSLPLILAGVLLWLWLGRERTSDGADMAPSG